MDTRVFEEAMRKSEIRLYPSVADTGGTTTSLFTYVSTEVSATTT
jgi:hypothetical protein